MDVRRGIEHFTFDAYTLLQHLPDRVTVTDPDGVIVYVNPSFEEVTGYTAAEAIGRKPSILKSGEHPDEFYRDLWQTITSGRPFRAEVINKKRNGELYYEDQLIVPIVDSGTCRGYISIARDITERWETEARIRYLAEHDELTGLLNRRGLLLRARRTLTMARHLNEPLTLLFVDLDNFKLINDGYGHQVGDLALAVAAQRLTACLRKGDLCGRWGGDEFVVILPRAGSETAKSIAKRLQDHLESPVQVNGASTLIYLQASIGMAVYPDDGESIDELITIADKSMYLAKDQASPIIHCDVRPRSSSQIQLALELPSAVQQKQFDLWFQPIFDFEAGGITKVEALLRWRHPNRGVVRPSEFISLAERSREIVAIDHWVVRQAVEEIISLERAGLRLQIAVNVSTRTLEEASFLDLIQEIGETAPQALKSLIVEVTEGAVLHVDRIMDLLPTLRAHGVRLALDDFGTGYSCLAYLEELPLDVVKIDRRFVKGVGKSRGSEAITRSIIKLCRELGFRTLAEGVETQEQFNWLAEAGCHEVQGYWIGRPAPRDHLKILASPEGYRGLDTMCTTG